MRRNKWKKMTLLQRRIKVAELCGWNHIAWDGNDWVGKHTDKPQYDSDHPLSIPDYLNDLNAMYDIENIFFKAGKSLVDTYEENLLICVADLNRDQWVDEIHHWHATAAQRAEAFVLTMEKE